MHVLQLRKEKELKRSQYLQILQDNALTEAEQALYTSTRLIGQQLTTKQQLVKCFKKYKAGLELNDNEMELLFPNSKEGEVIDNSDDKMNVTNHYDKNHVDDNNINVDVFNQLSNEYGKGKKEEKQQQQPQHNTAKETVIPPKNNKKDTGNSSVVGNSNVPGTTDYKVGFNMLQQFNKLKSKIETEKTVIASDSEVTDNSLQLLPTPVTTTSILPVPSNTHTSPNNMTTIQDTITTTNDVNSRIICDKHDSNKYTPSVSNELIDADGRVCTTTHKNNDTMVRQDNDNLIPPSSDGKGMLTQELQSIRDTIHRSPAIQVSIAPRITQIYDMILHNCFYYVDTENGFTYM